MLWLAFLLYSETPSERNHFAARQGSTGGFRSQRSEIFGTALVAIIISSVKARGACQKTFWQLMSIPTAP
jgi:hypothetical protein